MPWADAGGYVRSFSGSYQWGIFIRTSGISSAVSSGELGSSTDPGRTTGERMPGAKPGARGVRSVSCTEGAYAVGDGSVYAVGGGTWTSDGSSTIGRKPDVGGGGETEARLRVICASPCSILSHLRRLGCGAMGRGSGNSTTEKSSSSRVFRLREGSRNQG